MVVDLVERASQFADTIGSIVRGTLSRDAAFVVTPFEGTNVAWVFPAGSTPARVENVPILPAPGAEQRLWLQASFQVSLDDSGEFLAVQTSVFALVICHPAQKHLRHRRPLIRVEYNRGAGNEPDGIPGAYRRSAAHVQVHGTSAELAYVRALNGEPVGRGTEELHIPVGGRRFRPSLEDFIEFLYIERLVPRLYAGWEDVIREPRALWLLGQLKAAVRNDPDAAADQLRSMGYSIEAPE